MHNFSNHDHQCIGTQYGVDTWGWDTLGTGEPIVYVHERMPIPSVETLERLMCKCGKEKGVIFPLFLHSYMHTSGLDAHALLGDHLISLLVEAGRRCDAQLVLDRLRNPNESAWKCVITAYIENGEYQYALCLHRKMLEGSAHPCEHTFAALLKSCAKLKDLERGYEIHARICRKGSEGDLFIGSTLVYMYANSGLLSKAQDVLDKLPVKNTISWNALIAGYVKCQQGVEAIFCFEKMQLDGVAPDGVTYTCILKACSILGDIDKGQEIHGEAYRTGFLENDPFVGSALVDMYARHGFLVKAQEVFDLIPVKDAVVWNALLAGYAEHGNGEDALHLFKSMQSQGFSPTGVTLVCVLKACASVGMIGKAEQIHAESVEKGLESEIFVGSALVDVYAKCGLLENAQKVFDNLKVRNQVSWNALVAGYAKHGKGEEVLDLMKKMELEGMPPTTFTFVCSLIACGSIGAAEKGQEIHAEVARTGFENDVFVSNALADMYVTCGLLVKARDVLVKLPTKNAISWNTLIAGYAQLGDISAVLRIFDSMNIDGQEASFITFVRMINACAHAGLVDKGHKCLVAMSESYGIMPTLEHNNCMVDLLGRAGQLDNAIALINNMPFHPNLVVWYTLLGACRKWNNLELGILAFEHTLQLDAEDGSAYIGMLNIYADANMVEDAKKVDAMREETRIEKFAA